MTFLSVIFGVQLSNKTEAMGPMRISDEQQLLTLWADVGRHENLSAGLPAFVQAFRERLPLQSLYLYDCSADQAELYLHYVWDEAQGLQPMFRPLAPHVGELAALHRWLAEGQVWVQEGEGPAPAGLSLLLHHADEAAVYLAPMPRPLGGGSMLVLQIQREVFASSELAFLQAALPPLAVMIDNDRKLREIERQRAAAEAERDSLLARLGRTSLSSETIIGADQGLRAVMQRVDQVAPTDASALILGETGSGKEVIARAIHERSHRRDGPFIRVNCGALPPELIDSELFGHDKGSFTGAINQRRGWFERASGGTLFLDEIGELPLAAQVRLLRVLQDGVLQRVGSEASIEVDVRVIAATHRDLPHMVQSGEFREDLWYRLAVFPLILPALRERTEDIEALALHFISRAANRMGIATPPLKRSDLERLKRYRWPGNVRELGAVLERAVILGQGRVLDLEAALGVELLRSAEPDGSAPAKAPPVTHIARLDEVIVAHLEAALTFTEGRVDGPRGAAKLLGVNANTLRGKFRRYGIDPADFRPG